MRDIRNKAVLITGAASGIGRATAIAFAHEGADPILIADINSDGLAETASKIKKLSRGVHSFVSDVADHCAVNRMVEDILRKVGRIDILVNVAGWGLMAPLEDLELTEWKSMLDVSLYGVIHTTSAIYPHMLKRKSGHIVNVASVDGLLVPLLYSVPYVTSKFGVVGLSEALMLEGSVHGIGVSCICPGAVRTPAFDTSPIKGFRPEIRKLGRMFLYFAEEPEDTARIIIKAVKKNRFLVVTTPFFRVSYFLRRHFSFISYRFARVWPRWYAAVADRYRDK